MVLLCVDRIDAIAHPTALVAHLAASGIVRSSELLDAAPWLTWRVPAPSMVAITCYYASLGLVVAAHHTRVRALGYLCLFVVGLSMCLGLRPPATSSLDADHLRLTMVDVGQGEAMALEVPGGRGAAASHVTMMVDTGGSPFGSAAFDIGARVVEPALWAAGIRSLATLVLTHGDPDHIGGASALIDDFRPGMLWQGIPVRRAMALQAVLARAANARVQVWQRHVGESFALGAARVVVLHPEAPEWERPRVRNDDSVVMEVIFGDVALLLTGDVGSDVERDLIPRLVPAKTRILKVGHHGSRTSTSAALLEAWRPQVALISCGRGNAFGHPAPDVIERLTAAGAAIYRTDRDGEITVTTDGRNVRVTTFAGGRPSRP
jgi:competence protein ComEC